jgi:hypothetical protein
MAEINHGSWKRKMRGAGKETVIELLPGIVAIEGYLRFEHVIFLCREPIFSVSSHSSQVNERYLDE